MRRLAALAIALFLASPARAEKPLSPPTHQAHKTPQKAAKGAQAHGKKQAKARRGVSPERLRGEVEGRISRSRERLEEHIAQKRLTPDKAARLRTAFNQGVLTVRAKLTAVAQDGVITRDEAREVRGLARQMKSRLR